MLGVSKVLVEWLCVAMYLLQRRSVVRFPDKMPGGGTQLDGPWNGGMGPPGRSWKCSMSFNDLLYLWISLRNSSLSEVWGVGMKLRPLCSSWVSISDRWKMVDRFKMLDSWGRGCPCWDLAPARSLTETASVVICVMQCWMSNVCRRELCRIRSGVFQIVYCI